MTSSQEPGQPVQRGRQVVPVRIRDGLPGVQRHAHPEGAELAPVLGQERALAGESSP